MLEIPAGPSGGASRPPSGAHRLLWVNHFAVTPAIGGGTRHYELARELTPRGWRTRVAASDFLANSRRYLRRADAEDRSIVVERSEDVEFLWLWAAPYLRNDWRRGLNWLTFARSVMRLPLEPAWRPDVVIGSSPQLFAALGAERIAARLGVPFVLEVRDLWPESLLAVGGRKGAFYHSLDRVARYLYRRAQRIIVLSRGNVEHLAARGIPRDRISYVPNGVDVSTFQPSDRATHTGLRLVYAGAHGPANGLDAVLDAAASLRSDERIRFLLIGDGPAKADLVRRARDQELSNVEFRDPVPKTSLSRLFQEMDAGLMVLRQSPLFAFGVSPNKLFDYFAAGLPVVCNVPGEVADMVRAAGAGQLAAPGSGAALATAIRRLAACTPAERARMGASAREWVEREHGRPVLAARLDATLRPLVNPCTSR